MPRHARTFSCDRAVLLFSACVITTAASAQPPSSARLREADQPRVLAESLEANASRLAARPGGWLEAARLQRRAAIQRGDDTSAVGAWTRAAWLYAGAGKLGIARQMMVHSAEHAAAGGDVERAMAAYLDAALIAAEDERSDVVPVLLHRMRLIAASPLLAQERREKLLARAAAEPRLARYATPSLTSGVASTPE